jgi:hypothetical protein
MFRKLIRWYNNIKVHTNNEAGSLYRSKNKEDIMYKEELAIISQAVLNEMEGYEFYKMAGDQAKTQGNKESSKNANEFIIKSTELDNKIRLLSEQQDNLINDIAQTNVESLKKKFIQKAEELEQEIVELKEEKEKLIQQNESIKLKKINFRGLVDMLLHSEEYLKNFDDIPKLRRYLRSMIDRVVYFKDRVEVHFKLLKQEIIFDIVPSEVFELKKKELETEKGNISKIKVKEQDNKMLLYLLGELWDRQELGKQDERLLNLIVEVMEEYKKLSIKEHMDMDSLRPPA